MQPIQAQIIYVGSSQYSTYRIIDMTYSGRPARILFGNDNSPQSGMARDDDPEPLFDYNQRFLEVMLSQAPRRALVIGGGVMMMPRAAHQLFPKLTIDVVEIDPLLIDIARDYFDLPTSRRLRAHVADGLEFVKSSRTKYDTVVIDAFDGYTVPPHLVDAAAAKHYQRSLTSSGVVTVNFISEYKPGEPSVAHDIIDSFSRHFSFIRVYQSDPDYDRGREQNMLLVASNAELTLEYLQSEDVTL